MKTIVLIALVGFVLAASYELPYSEDEDERLASENELEETNNDFPSERKINQEFEDDIYDDEDANYKEIENRKDEDSAIRNDVDNFIEGEEDSAFNDLTEQLSDPRRRGRSRRRRRRRRSRRRYCIRLPGACGKK